jgi:hypothetical protein
MNIERAIAFVFLGLALIATGIGIAHAVDEVKLHTSGSTSANVLVYKIGQEKGYYREENLNVLAITATSQAGIQGLVGGSFDFSQILGQTSAAILHGAPLKNVMAFDTRPLFWFFGSKKIKRVQDLKGGKLIGVSSIGANTDQMTREILATHGSTRSATWYSRTEPSVWALIGVVRRRHRQPHRKSYGAQTRAERAVLYGDYDLNIAAARADGSNIRKPDPSTFSRGTLRACLVRAERVGGAHGRRLQDFARRCAGNL